MLQKGVVDAVVHVRQNVGEAAAGNLYEYTVTRSAEELLATSRSAYYPITLARVIELMRADKARFAITGVPCFIKALRLLTTSDEVLRERIAVAVGIVCGHLKSKAFAEHLAWQLGVSPDDLGGIEFRGKLEGQRANNKGVSAYSLSRQEWTPLVSSKRLLGGDWGQSLFKYKACDYCDDVFAETADVVVGDAWLPKYVEDSKGTSIIVCRNPDVQRMLDEGVSTGQLVLHKTKPEQIVRSQAGGVRHKREGLAYRLSVDESNNKWHPPKRVMASTRLRKRRQKMYTLRAELAAASHKAFNDAKKSKNPMIFKNQMQGLIDSYQASKVSTIKAVRRKFVAALTRMFHPVALKRK
jgi:coenzyme F420-reducing hydrogenase beta subunit